jgi:flagellar basal-body rod protein FlgB
MMSMLENYLKLTSSRVQAVTANMANVDTPGYRTRDLNVESEFHKIMNQTMRPSEDGIETVQLSPVVREVRGLMERPDGNNVSIDQQGLLLARTQLQYQLAIQLIQNHFHRTLNAINGGGAS